MARDLAQRTGRAPNVAMSDSPSSQHTPQEGECLGEAGVAFSGQWLPEHALNTHDPIVLHKISAQEVRVKQHMNTPPHTVIANLPKPHAQRAWAMQLAQHEHHWKSHPRLLLPMNGMGHAGAATLGVLVAYGCYLLRRRPIGTEIIVLQPLEEDIPCVL